MHLSSLWGRDGNTWGVRHNTIYEVLLAPKHLFLLFVFGAGFHCVVLLPEIRLALPPGHRSPAQRHFKASSLVTLRLCLKEKEKEETLPVEGPLTNVAGAAQEQLTLDNITHVCGS